jgi:hypothetical protein
VTKPPSFLSLLLGKILDPLGNRPMTRSGCLSAVAPVVIVIAIFTILTVIAQAIFHPWGRSLTGAPTLPGKWIGEGATPSGQKVGMYLTMDALIWGSDEGCQRGCDLDGIARVCMPGGIREYTIQGDVNEHHGRQFRIDLSKSEDRPYGFLLREMRGEWPGGGTMRLAGTFELNRSNTSTTEEGVWIDTEGQRHKLTAADRLDTTQPTAWMMRRGSAKEFERYCLGITAIQPAPP